MKPGGMLSIWFFIGFSLLVNGIIICGAGVYQYMNPPAPELQVVLYQYHAGLWWGVVLALIGAFFCWQFSPRRSA